MKTLFLSLFVLLYSASSFSASESDILEKISEVPEEKIHPKNLILNGPEVLYSLIGIEKGKNSRCFLVLEFDSLGLKSFDCTCS